MDTMKCNTISQKLKNITSIGITLIIVILLILSGPANAVLVEISGLSSEYTKGNEVKFKISITLHDPDKYVPITNFSLNLMGPTPNVWIFDTTGTVIPLDTGNITINGISVPNATTYGGPGEGFGEDSNTGENFSFPSGFGYGSNSGAGDGGNVTYIYEVTLYTTNLATGDYKVTASLNTGNDDKPSFTSTKAQFKINPAPVTPPSGGGGGGGGGGGTSGEDFKNIVCTETDRQYVGKDIDVKYNFNLDSQIRPYLKANLGYSFNFDVSDVEISRGDGVSEKIVVDISEEYYYEKLIHSMEFLIKPRYVSNLLNMDLILDYENEIELTLENPLTNKTFTCYLNPIWQYDEKKIKMVLDIYMSFQFLRVKIHFLNN